MNDTNQTDDWRSLCEMASKEHNPQKLLELIVKINQALARCSGRNDGRDMPSETDAIVPLASDRRDVDFLTVPLHPSPVVEYDC